MSISSVGSTASCWVNGQEIPLEIQLEEVVKKLQNHLNRAQLHLREIASVCEQDDDLASELQLSGDLDQELLDMGFLFDDMRSMCLGLISEPNTKEEKAMVKAFKEQRKAHEKSATAAHKMRIAAERVANKEARMESVAESKEMEQD